MKYITEAPQHKWTLGIAINNEATRLDEAGWHPSDAEFLALRGNLRGSSHQRRIALRALLRKLKSIHPKKQP